MTNCSPPPVSMNWQCLPLCRRMFLVACDAISVPVGMENEPNDSTIIWALGLLPSGQCELLGVRRAPDSGDRTFQAIVDELRLRGVEHVKFVVSGGLKEERRNSWAVFRGAAMLPSAGQLIRLSLREVAPRARASVVTDLERMRAAGSVAEARAHLAAFAASSRVARYPAVVARWNAALERMGPLYAMPRRQRAIVDSGDDLVCRLHRSLVRAVARHGVFADHEAAVAFLVRALRRADRGLDIRAAETRTLRAVRTERSDRCSGVAALSS